MSCERAQDLVGVRSNSQGCTRSWSRLVFATDGRTAQGQGPSRLFVGEIGRELCIDGVRYG